MTVGATHGTGEKLPSDMRIQKPDVVLLDLSLRSQNSLEIVKLMRRDFPAVKVIVMDLVPVLSDIVAFVEAGVSGFILKNASIVNFLSTIRSVSLGKKVLPPILTDSLFSQIIEHALTKEKESTLNEAVRMTKRERQIIELVAKGMTNKEIAENTHLSSNTVKSHIHNILEKLAIHSRIQIATYSASIVSISDLAGTASPLDQ
jgi:RNA polymerase sigma factor (sigma-70 family)